MKNYILPCVVLAACGQAPEPTEQHVQKPDYPATRKDSLAGDTLHGTFVADPYRWLEDDTSKATAEWVKAQNGVTDAYLSGIAFREAIAKRYEELYNFPKTTAPYKVGDLFCAHCGIALSGGQE